VRGLKDLLLMELIWWNRGRQRNQRGRVVHIAVPAFATPAYKTARSCEYFVDCRYRTAFGIHYNLNAALRCRNRAGAKDGNAGALTGATCYDTVTPHFRSTFFAKPNGSGVKGPGGARVIRATQNSAAIASQKHSQKPSI